MNSNTTVNTSQIESFTVRFATSYAGHPFADPTYAAGLAFIYQRADFDIDVAVLATEELANANANLDEQNDAYYTYCRIEATLLDGTVLTGTARRRRKF